jgi:hypothetical protein
MFRHLDSRPEPNPCRRDSRQADPNSKLNEAYLAQGSISNSGRR